jgi:FAD:protein FMN transferase
MKFAAYLILFTLCFSCLKSTHYVRLEGKAMGSTYHVSFATDDSEFDRLGKEIQSLMEQRLAEINQQMSTYANDSEISRFNALTEINQAFPIGKDFKHVLDHAVKVANLSDGFFDPTVFPLVNFWGFGPLKNSKDEEPDLKLLPLILESVGVQKIQFDWQSSSIKKLHSGVMLDLSASAPGYAADVMAEILEARGIRDYMVELAGEIVLKGRGPQGKWNIAIEEPNFELKRFVKRILHISDMTLATSGNYRNFYESGGQIKAHLINPKTAQAEQSRLLSVTVLDNQSCMNADAMATTLMVMGLQQGYKFAEKLNLAAYFIYRDEVDREKLHTQMTKSFQKITEQKQ